jgi:DNA-binding CsgD family transcriptional regulator
VPGPRGPVCLRQAGYRHLASGLSVAEVARQLHVSHHTVRSHLKSLFQKTGTTPQSALVSRILRLQAQAPERPA